MHNPVDRMKDPYYAMLLFQIEHIICQADDDARARGLQLTDSQVRSAILKARKKVQGAEPDIPETNEREQILAALIDSICQAPDNMLQRVVTDAGRIEEKPLPMTDWGNALETVANSIKTRKSNLPGSREYLDFLHGFIAQARRTQ
jgi:hypothetical protein